MAVVAKKPYEFESFVSTDLGLNCLFTGAAHDLDYRFPRVSHPFCSYWFVDFRNDRTGVSFPDVLATCLHVLLFATVTLHAADTRHSGLGKWIPTKI